MEIRRDAANGAPGDCKDGSRNCSGGLDDLADIEVALMSAARIPVWPSPPSFLVDVRRNRSRETRIAPAGIGVCFYCSQYP